MAFLIRSTDGRTTICTSCPSAAARHARRLRRAGTKVKVTDLNGVQYEAAGLLRVADALKATRAAILQTA